MIGVGLDGFILSSNAITVVFNVLYNDLIDSFVIYARRL